MFHDVILIVPIVFSPDIGSSASSIRRFCSIQENARSTIHRYGNTWKPGGGSSFSQSIFTPSLAHSLAHNFRTSLGAGFRGHSTNSTLHPKAFFRPNPCPCPLRGKHCPATGA